MEGRLLLHMVLRWIKVQALLKCKASLVTLPIKLLLFLLLVALQLYSDTKLRIYMDGV